MASASALSTSTLLLLLLLVSLSLADDALIDQLCNKSRNVDFCLHMLSTDPFGKACPNKVCMSYLGVSNANTHAIATRDQAKVLLGKNPPPSRLARPLTTCLGLYEGTNTDLMHAFLLMDNYEFAAAENLVVHAGLVIRECERAFSLHPSPLASANRLTDVYLEVAAAILSCLVPGSEQFG